MAPIRASPGPSPTHKGAGGVFAGSLLKSWVRIRPGLQSRAYGLVTGARREIPMTTKKSAGKTPPKAVKPKAAAAVKADAARVRAMLK